MKRTISVIHEDDGTTEVQWSSSEPETPGIQGYVQIDPEGRLIVPFTRDDEPYVFVLGDVAAIYASEDAVAEHDTAPIWAAKEEVSE